MRIGRSLRISAAALGAHKLRTGLAFASVSAGVIAVVLTGAIGAGAERDVDRGIQRMGVNLLVVRPARLTRLVARKEIGGSATTLRLEDYEAIVAMPGVAMAAPAIEGRARVKGGNATTLTMVLGTTAVFPAVRRFEVRSGRFFDDDDDRAARRVAVLGARVASSLFGAEDPCGRQIRIRGVPFDVIGVLAPKGVLADGDEDSQVLLPIRTALRRVYNATWLTTVFVSAADSRRIAETEARLRAELQRRHRPTADGQPDFEIQNAARFFSLQRRAGESLRTLGAWLAGVALLVGGTGIMALMFLSVKERTTEIGLRVAIGASPRDIVTQFLLEATALALGGWAGGMVIAGTAGIAIAMATNLSVVAPADTIAASFVMAVAVGLGFGALPARRAALIPPIRALGSK
jgi:putative ABC transport system permease protein